MVVDQFLLNDACLMMFLLGHDIIYIKRVPMIQ